MRVHVILDLVLTDGPRISFDEITPVLEEELEGFPIDLNDSTFEINVLGVGRNSAEAATSAQLMAKLKEKS